MFTHVSDNRLRDILDNSLTDEKSILYALAATQAALDEDEENDDIPYEVLDVRIDNYQDACRAYGRGKDAEALTSLQKVWS